MAKEFIVETPNGTELFEANTPREIKTWAREALLSGKANSPLTCRARHSGKIERAVLTDAGVRFEYEEETRLGGPERNKGKHGG